MNDQLWLQTLANATFQNGKWVPAEPIDAGGQVRAALEQLHQDLIDACQAFNTYSRSARHLNIPEHVLPTQEGPICRVLLGKTQMLWLLKNSQLEVHISSVRDYTPQMKILFALQPFIDSLGTVYWRTAAGLLLNNEQVIKECLQEICRIAAQSAEF